MLLKIFLMSGMVREMLKDELKEIDELVKQILT